MIMLVLDDNDDNDDDDDNDDCIHSHRPLELQ